MNLRQRSVNVNRIQLLKTLDENRALHRVEYAAALVEFQERLTADLKLAVKTVSKVTDPEDLKDFKFSLEFPKNHERDYTDVIEMLEMSVDENINLDSESFKAYFKNEWSWANMFFNMKKMYAVPGSSIQI